jgi:integrase
MTLSRSIRLSRNLLELCDFILESENTLSCSIPAFPGKPTRLWVGFVGRMASGCYWMGAALSAAFTTKGRGTMLENELTAAAVKHAKPGKYRDGGGLTFEVKGGSRRWTFSYMWQGKQCEVAVGKYPAMSLADAREWRTKLREAKAQNTDPRSALPANAPPPSPIVTMRMEMEAHIHHREGKVKASSVREMRRLLEKDAKALLDMEPSKITEAVALEVIRPLWDTRRRSTEKVIAYTRMIWRFSQGAAKVNPFADLEGKDKLRPGGDTPVKSHPAMPFDKLPAFFAMLRARPETEARALELLLLTCCPRTAEVMNAKWEQFDGYDWHVPETKERPTGRTIPLSDAAMNLLLAIKPIGNKPGDWVFPARIQCNSGRKGEDAMQVLLRVGMRQPYTVHGFRSTLMDWSAAKHPMLLLAVERALDHELGSKVTQAYLRTGLVDNRRELADLWAAHLLSAA